MTFNYSGTSVMEELEKIAIEKKWLTVEAGPDAGLIKSIQQQMNELVGRLHKPMPPQYNVFPLDVDGVFGPKSTKGIRGIMLVAQDAVKNTPNRHMPQHRELITGISEMSRGTPDALLTGLKYLNKYFYENWGEKIKQKEPQIKLPEWAKNKPAPVGDGTDEPDWEAPADDEKKSCLHSEECPPGQRCYQGYCEEYMEESPIKGASNKTNLEKIAMNPREWFNSLDYNTQSRVRRKVYELMKGRGFDQEGALGMVMRQMNPPEPKQKPPLKQEWPDTPDFNPDDFLREVERGVQEQYPSFKMTSSVINSLVSLANDLDDMGAKEASFSVDNQIKIYKEALDKLYDVTGETGEQLIEKAHPGGGPTIAPSKEEGGKVETVVEEQKKSIDKATKKPTGKYAQTVSKLIALANKLEDEGNVKAALQVDESIREMRALLPFSNRSSVIEAAGSEDKKASVVKKGFSLTETLETDINDYAIVLGIMYKLNQEQRPLYSGAYKNLKNLLLKYLSKAKYYENYSKQSNAKNYHQLIIYYNNLERFTKKIVDNSGTMSDMGMFSIRLASHLRSIQEGLVYLGKAMDSFDYTTSPKKALEPLSGNSRQRAIKSYLKDLKTLENLIQTQDPVKVGKILNGGLKAIDQLEKWIEKRRYNLTVTDGNDSYIGDKLELPHITQLRNYISKLQKGLGKTSGIKFYKFVKTALDGAPPVGIGGGSATPRRRTRSVVNRKPKDQQVVKLQRALKKANFDTGKIDGYWGKNTAAAFNAMLAKLGQSRGRAFKQFSGDKKPNPKVLRFGIYAANLYQRKDIPKGRFFVLTDTGEIDLPLSALNSPSSFIGALELNSVIRKDLSAEEKVKAAEKVLIFTAKKLNPPDKAPYVLGRVEDLMDLSYIDKAKNNLRLLNKAYVMLKPFVLKVKNKEKVDEKSLKQNKLKPSVKSPSAKRSVKQKLEKAMLKIMPEPGQLTSLESFERLAQVNNMTAREYYPLLKSRIVGVMRFMKNNKSQLVAELGSDGFLDKWWKLERVSRDLDRLKAAIR